MAKIGIIGASGRMGQELRSAIKEFKNAELGSLVDKSSIDSSEGMEFVKNLSEVKLNNDVFIDFTGNLATSENLDYLQKLKKPVVIGSTGLDSRTIQKIEEYSKTCPVLYSSNMSIGVNALLEILKTAVKVLKDYDIEIVEEHHKFKKDSPSGTALTIAKGISDNLKEQFNKNIKYVMNREEEKNKIRTQNEIGIQSIRAGSIIGEHEIIFAQNDEIIRISHSALSRKIFAVGAIKAALFIHDKAPKIYTMREVLGL